MILDRWLLTFVEALLTLLNDWLGVSQKQFEVGCTLLLTAGGFARYGLSPMSAPVLLDGGLLLYTVHILTPHTRRILAERRVVFLTRCVFLGMWLVNFVALFQPTRHSALTFGLSTGWVLIMYSLAVGGNDDERGRRIKALWAAVKEALAVRSAPETAGA